MATKLEGRNGVSTPTSPPLTHINQSIRPAAGLSHKPDISLEGHVYRADVKNDYIEPLPTVVHFGGFDIHQTHRFSVKLLNKGPSATRLHVIQPTTKFFSCITRKGNNGLYPGFSETVEIEFTPTEWRYYYDCVRIHVESGDNLLIPIHGYPVPGKAKIPNTIDFGKCGIATPVTKSIPLKCDVPIDFEFNVKVTDPSPEIKISPSKGTLPANGSTEINVTFTPLAFSTASSTFEVTLNQFGATPMKCNVLGSCVPGVAQKQKMKELMEKEPLSISDDSTQKRTSTISPRPPMSQKRSKSRSARSGARTAVSATSKATTVVIDGVVVPKNLTGMALVSKIMNQPAPGLLAGNAKALVSDLTEHPDDLNAYLVARSARERAFISELEAEKLSTHQSGVQPPTDDEVEAIQRAYSSAQDRLDEVTGHAATIYSLEDCLQSRIDSCLYRSVRQVNGSGEAAQLVPEGSKITFKPNPADGWQHRVRILARFVAAVRKVIFRCRAAKRLKIAAEYRKNPHLSQSQPEQNSDGPVESKDQGIMFQPDEYVDTELPQFEAVPVFGFVNEWSTEEPVSFTFSNQNTGLWKPEVPREYVLAGYSTVSASRDDWSFDPEPEMELPELKIEFDIEPTETPLVEQEAGSN